VQTYSAFSQHELSKLINVEIERLKENLSSGLSTPDFSAYKHQIGVIDGLKTALELMLEAENAANGAERGM
jgi:hypothetical protein